MQVHIDGYDIEVELSGSYAPERKFQKEQFPSIRKIKNLPEEVSRERVKDRVQEKIKEEENKSRSQKRAEHKASKL